MGEGTNLATLTIYLLIEFIRKSDEVHVRAVVHVRQVTRGITAKDRELGRRMMIGNANFVT